MSGLYERAQRLVETAPDDHSRDLALRIQDAVRAHFIQRNQGAPMTTLRHEITKAEQAAIAHATSMLKGGQSVARVAAFLDAEQVRIDAIRAGGNPVTTAASDVMAPVPANHAETRRTVSERISSRWGRVA